MKRPQALPQPQFSTFDTLPLDEMIGLALRHGMIDEGACRSGSVQVRLGRARVSLDEQRGRLFVLGVVRACQCLLRAA